MNCRVSSLVDLPSPSVQFASSVKSFCTLLAAGQSASRIRLPIACVTLALISDHKDVIADTSLMIGCFGQICSFTQYHELQNEARWLMG